jgi:hypothetical protein
MSLFVFAGGKCFCKILILKKINFVFIVFIVCYVKNKFKKIKKYYF